MPVDISTIATMFSTFSRFFSRHSENRKTKTLTEKTATLENRNEISGGKKRIAQSVRRSFKTKKKKRKKSFYTNV